MHQFVFSVLTIMCSVDPFGVDREGQITVLQEQDVPTDNERDAIHNSSWITKGCGQSINLTSVGYSKETRSHHIDAGGFVNDSWQGGVSAEADAEAPECSQMRFHRQHRMLTEIFSYHIAVTLGLGDNIPETKVQVPSNGKREITIQCGSCCSSELVGGGSLCSCGLPQVWLVRGTQEIQTMVEFRQSRESDFWNNTLCFRNSTGRNRDEFVVREACRKPVFRKVDLCESKPLYDVRIRCSDGEALKQLVGMVIFDAMMFNNDRFASYKRGHNAFADLAPITSKNPSLKLTFIDNAQGQFEFFMGLLNKEVNGNAMAHLEKEPQEPKLAYDPKDGWLGGMAGLKHNCQLPPQLATVFKTVHTGAEFVNTLRVRMGQELISAMDTHFDGYEIWGSCTRNLPRQRHETSDLMSAFEVRYDKIRKIIPASCYNAPVLANIDDSAGR
jgi:hypothetical protein